MATSVGRMGELNQDAFAMLQGLGLPPANAGQLSINGITYPLEDRWVLTPEEQSVIGTAIAAYNQTIAALAQQYDVAFVDIHAYFDILATEGIALSDGSTVTAEYATGGGFSLDGVHPAPRGYALVANQFVDAINAKYGSNLPGVNPLDFTGLYIN
jgi:lysophospholipase L1-like esterase